MIVPSGMYEANPGDCCCRCSRRTAGCQSATQTRKARRRIPRSRPRSPTARSRADKEARVVLFFNFKVSFHNCIWNIYIRLGLDYLRIASKRNNLLWEHLWSNRDPPLCICNLSVVVPSEGYSAANSCDHISPKSWRGLYKSSHLR